jgi:hypothetical protein
MSEFTIVLSPRAKQRLEDIADNKKNIPLKYPNN